MSLYDHEQELSALREQLSQLSREREEAAKQEPVAWIARHKNDLPDDGNLHIYAIKSDAEKWLSQYQPGFAWLEPLYCKPVNLPALIAAAKQEERRNTLNELKQRLSDNDESAMWNIENMLREIGEEGIENARPD